MDFIGRKKEIAELKSTLESNNNEFVAIYGKKGVGKTYLVKHVLEDRFDFYYTGLYKQTKNSQLNHFESTLLKYGLTKSPIITWFDAFDALKNYLLSLNKDKVCVFIDELPWMDSKNSGFVQAFTDFWNMWDSLNENHVKLKLYICGSATTWIIKKIIKDKGGLHNRITSSIHLRQFNLLEAKEYFKNVMKINYSEMEVLDIYLATGGIPYYLSKFKQKTPVSKQINELFFTEGGSLRDEFDYLYESLFNDSKNYKKIIFALNSKNKGLTRDELISLTKIEGGALTELLDNLEQCDFIRRYNTPKNKTKESIYQLIDLYTIFYLHYVLNSSPDENYWTNLASSNKVISWKGFAFERVILLHIPQIKKALGFEGVSTNAYEWISKQSSDNKKYQIDLIIDRGDNVMNICEIKYSGGLYSLNNEYSKYLNERIEYFRNETKTKKALKNTIITTFGIDAKSGNLPDASVTLKDIFN